jgi:hypothetical protein
MLIGDQGEKRFRSTRLAQAKQEPSFSDNPLDASRLFAAAAFVQ